MIIEIGLGIWLKKKGFGLIRVFYMLLIVMMMKRVLMMIHFFGWL